MNLGNVSVVIATLLAWASLLPQIAKLIRTGDTTGVSTTWPAIGLVSNAAWTAYLLSQRLWAATPSTVVMVVFYLILLRALNNRGAYLKTAAVRGIVWASILISSTALWGWSTGGLILSWSYVVQIAPAIWSAYGTDDPSGVSASTWALITVEAALWGVYGWWFSDQPVIVFGVVGTLGGALILARLGTVRFRRERDGPLPVNRPG